jgi:hypothetical protein
MRMKRKSRKSSDTMERILLSNEMTRLRKDAQYLQRETTSDPTISSLVHLLYLSLIYYFILLHFINYIICLGTYNVSKLISQLFIFYCINYIKKVSLL